MTGELRCIAYLRDTPFLTVEQQIATIQTCETEQRIQVLSWLVERSEYQPEPSCARPGLQRAHNEIVRDRYSTLVVAAWPVLSESVLSQEAFHHDLIDVGGRLVVATDANTDEARRRLVRDVIAADRAYLAKRGKARSAAGAIDYGVTAQAAGRVPFGWQCADGKLVHKPDERPVCDRIVRDRKNGLTLEKIADGLNADGIPSPRGSRWTIPRVQAVLRREYPQYVEQRWRVYDRTELPNLAALLADENARIHPDFV